MKARAEESASRPGAMVSMANISIVVIAFGIGFVIALFLQNFLAKQDITLTTQQLILLVFTVAVGAASVILAVVAIVISRKAEESLTRRSEEGIRLQNEVFLRTNEVLSKIQTSTGLTEKRLDDIITGRAGVIAQAALDKSLGMPEPILTKEMAQKIKEDLARSIKEELVPLISSPASAIEQILSTKEAEQRTRDEVNAKWRDFRESVVARLRQFPDVTFVSEAEGNVGSEDSSTFWDAVVSINDKRVSLDVHTKDQLAVAVGVYLWRTDNRERSRYVRRLTWRIQQDELALTFVVFDEDVWQEEGTREVARLLDDFSERDSKARVVRLFGDPDSLAEQIYSISVERQ